MNSSRKTLTGFIKRHPDGFGFFIPDDKDHPDVYVPQNAMKSAMTNDKATILYRMAQEVLNNMVKHSRAKKITVLLNASEKLITLVISDDGIGFSISEKMNSGGAGLSNLQNRAALIKATLLMQSTPGNGSQTTIELPV